MPSNTDDLESITVAFLTGSGKAQDSLGRSWEIVTLDDGRRGF